MQSVCEDLFIENHGGRRCRNFAKFWKVEDVKLFSVKYNSIFGVGYYDRKNDILSFMDVLSLVPFLKNPEEKNF